MIKNILFDMGNVLIHFDRKVFLDRLDISEEDKQLLLREVFLSVEWVQMDRGTLTEPEACFFIDDVPANIEGAQYCGISGTVFHKDVSLLRSQLRTAGIPVEA